jgi:hypothetical protein
MNERVETGGEERSARARRLIPVLEDQRPVRASTMRREFAH